jgi:FeS assembly SUF system protein
VFWKKRDEKEPTKSNEPAESPAAAEARAVAEARVAAEARAAARAPESVPPPARVTGESAPAAEAAAPSAAPASDPAAETKRTPDGPLETGLLREQVIGQLRTVFDPEIPVNIYELGLVYKIDVDADGNVKVEMTLTSPACPSAAEIPLDVRRKVESIEGVKSVDVEIVWDPPWTMEFMSEAARVQLGFF